MFVWSSSYIYCMKKTRFFYEINYFLIVLLGWLLLFHKAAEVNRARERRLVCRILEALRQRRTMTFQKLLNLGMRDFLRCQEKSVCFSWIQAINLIIIPL